LCCRATSPWTFSPSMWNAELWPETNSSWTKACPLVGTSSSPRCLITCSQTSSMAHRQLWECCFEGCENRRCRCCCCCCCRVLLLASWQALMLWIKCDFSHQASGVFVCFTGVLEQDRVSRQSTRMKGGGARLLLCPGMVPLVCCTGSHWFSWLLCKQNFKKVVVLPTRVLIVALSRFERVDGHCHKQVCFCSWTWCGSLACSSLQWSAPNYWSTQLDPPPCVETTNDGWLNLIDWWWVSSRVARLMMSVLLSWSSLMLPLDDIYHQQPCSCASILSSCECALGDFHFYQCLKIKTRSGFAIMFCTWNVPLSWQSCTTCMIEVWNFSIKNLTTAMWWQLSLLFLLLQQHPTQPLNCVDKIVKNKKVSWPTPACAEPSASMMIQHELKNTSTS